MVTISLKDLSKKFGHKTVLKQQSISFSSGQIYGIVGYNGCGKTVLLKCICGLQQPTTGNIDIHADGSPSLLRPLYGAMIDGAGFIESYTAIQNLTVLSNILGKVKKTQIHEIMRKVGLDINNRKKIKNYSLGMRQRLALVQALMEDPPVLLLDEPLNGLDCEGIQTVYQILCEQKKKDKLILIASHHEEDIRLLCDQIYWLKDGELQKIDSVEIYTSHKKEYVKNN